MATGKTKALLDYLSSDQVPKDAGVVIISFCKSFTSELHKKVGPKTITSKINTNKVIVQYESLMWLKLHDLDKTILILEESESHCVPFDAPFLNM